MADWDIWVEDEIQRDIMVSTSSGETSSDSSLDSLTSDSDTDDSRPSPNQHALGKTKCTQARAEVRRFKLSLRTRDTEPDDSDEIKLVNPYAQWESSNDTSGWFTPVTDEPHFGYVNGSNQINWPGNSTLPFISGSPIQSAHWFNDAHSVNGDFNYQSDLEDIFNFDTPELASQASTGSSPLPIIEPGMVPIHVDDQVLDIPAAYPIDLATHPLLTASQIVVPMIMGNHEVDDALLLMVAATINGIMDNGVPSDVSNYVSLTTAVSLTDSDRSNVRVGLSANRVLFDFNAGSSKKG